MPNDFVHPDVPLLRYAIREIVDVMQKLSELDPEYQFVRENIGDPIAKGWPVPSFLKEILIDEIRRDGDASFGYSHSRGIPAVRKWVVDYARKFSPSSKLDYEYVLFTNGLGSAIAAVYHMLKRGSRILQPAPCYPSHASMESFSAGSEPLLYHLDPHHGWEPDLDHMESQLKTHPEVAGILIINPNNPTGAVYSKTMLESIVEIASKHQVMLISDEIYFRMVYNGKKHVQITDLAQDRVPLIVMRGVSKDVPWPGGRSGWLEFHNTGLSTQFRDYCEAVKKRMLMEVCSTTLPQTIIPRIYEHPGFNEWNRVYNEGLAANGNRIAEILSASSRLKVNRPDGAFYMMPLFEEGVLNNRQKLPIRSSSARDFIEKELSKPGILPDQRFAYYLLASTGICVVPASGFYSRHPGFRLTTLERGRSKLDSTYLRLVSAIDEYLAS